MSENETKEVEGQAASSSVPDSANSDAKSADSSAVAAALESVNGAVGKVASVLHSRTVHGMAEITVAATDIYTVLETLKNEEGFSMLLCVSGVDYFDEEFDFRHSEERFEVVYHLLNLSNKVRLRVKAGVAEENAKVATVVPLWPAADFMEREVWDMVGISFEGHPNLRRILMYDEFKGHPLQKDYPVQAKQARIELLAPEVENTARQMKRPPLVQINPRQTGGS